MVHRHHTDSSCSKAIDADMGLQPEALLESGSHAAARAIYISVTCAATQGHSVIEALTLAEVHVWVYGPIAARVWVDTCSSCYHLDTWCLVSYLRPC